MYLWQWTKSIWIVQLRKQNQILQWLPPKDRQISNMQKNQKLLHPLSLSGKTFFPHFSPQNLIFTFIFHFINLKRTLKRPKCTRIFTTGVFLQIWIQTLVQWWIYHKNALFTDVDLVKFWTWLIFVPNFDLYKFDAAIVPYYLCLITL